MAQATIDSKSKLSHTPHLSIVIPAFNEERRIPSTLHLVCNYLRHRPYPSELLIVDDGSTDNTASVVRKFAHSFPNIKLLTKDHRGKAYAVRAGMLAASGRYILFSDADLAVPMEEFDKLYGFLERGIDVVIGSREGEGAVRIGEPVYRHLMGRCFNFVTRMLIGNFSDTQCGFKAFTQLAARHIFSQVRLYDDSSKTIKGAAVTAFDVELLFLAVKYGYRVQEVPVQWKYGTESKVSALPDALRNFRDVLTVRLNDAAGSYDNIGNTWSSPSSPVDGTQISVQND